MDLLSKEGKEKEGKNDRYASDREGGCWKEKKEGYRL